MSIRCYDTDVAKYRERLTSPKKNKKVQVESFYDPYVLGFSIGCNGTYHRTDTFNSFVKEPCLFRGMGKSPQIKQCIENNIDWYYIDTGYLGNDKFKTWHRISKNNFQVQRIMDIKDSQLVPEDITRFEKNFGTIKPGARSFGNKILIAPPSQKVFNHFGGEAEKYTNKLVEKIKKLTDREIEIRHKAGRSERLGFSVQDQLRTGEYHCVVTFNSIASIESVLVGMPAIVLGPNAGECLSETKLENIEEPYYPDFDKIRNHIFYLSCCQFTSEEMQSIVTKRTIEILQGDQKPNNFKL